MAPLQVNPQIQHWSYGLAAIAATKGDSQFPEIRGSRSLRKEVGH